MARPEFKSVSGLADKKVAIDGRQIESNNNVRSAMVAAAAEVRGDAKITQLSSWNNFQKFELVCQAIVESVACTALDPRNLNGAGRAFHFESEKWKTPPKNKSSTGLTNSGSKPESPMGGTRSSIIKPNKSYGTRIDPLHCALPTTFNPRSDSVEAHQEVVRHFPVCANKARG
jgi:hypothetical protein